MFSIRWYWFLLAMVAFSVTYELIEKGLPYVG